MPTLQSPSLGYFLGPVIKAKKFDQKNGLNITFKPEPTSTYRTNFAAGTSEVGGSGTLLTDVGLLAQKGGKVQYLFNIFDFWGALVSPASANVASLKDLTGKPVAAVISTANFAMFKYVAQENGLDPASLKLQNVQTPALAPTAESGRVAGVEMWEPAYTILTNGKGSGKFTTFDLAKMWAKITGQSKIPYLGIAAHTSWIDSHQKLIPELYKTYSDAANYVRSQPKAAADIIAKATKIDSNDVLALLQSDRLNLNVYWASSQKSAVDAVFTAAVKSGYLKSVPQGVIYERTQ